MNWIEGIKCSAEDTASMIRGGDILVFLGFALAGYPKAVPLTLSQTAQQEFVQNDVEVL